MASNSWVIGELERKRRARELDHAQRAQTPGTQGFASAARKELFPSPASFVANTPLAMIPGLGDVAEYHVAREQGSGIPAALAYAALPMAAAWGGGKLIQRGADALERSRTGEPGLPVEQMETSALMDTIRQQLPGGGQAATFEKASKEIPGFSILGKHMTDDEKALLESTAWRKFGNKVVDTTKIIPSIAERAAVSTAGGAKRGWYRDSEKAIRHIFANQQNPDDPERFTALLAALSPQTSVQGNLKNALHTWRNWTDAGRPTDTNQILRIMGDSVEGDKGVDSVLGSWQNNAFRALTAPDVRDMVGRSGLSGPKVNSFFNNLMGVSDEVTNDAWVAKLAGIEQKLFGGASRTGAVDSIGNIGGKGAGYVAENVQARRAAQRLGWDPMEMQETGWSFGKTLQDLATSPEAIRKSMQEFDVPIPEAYRNLEPTTAVEALKAGLLTDEAIAAVPAFGDLMRFDPYKGILGGSSEGLVLPKPQLSSPYERIGVAPGDLERVPAGRHLLSAARRLDLSTERADALTRLEDAKLLQAVAKTPADKRRANASLGRAVKGLNKSARGLPNIRFDPELRKYLK